MQNEKLESKIEEMASKLQEQEKLSYETLERNIKEMNQEFKKEELKLK